jgi:hypothetical protein
VTLLLVLVVLTLLALLGVALVFYASSSLKSARLNLEAQSQRRPDAEPELLLSYFLGQLLFDTPDDETGVYSGLRGHSLSRDLFGLNYVIGLDGSLLRTPDGLRAVTGGNVLNNVPFNGTGRQEFDPRLPFPALQQLTGDDPAKHDANLINYTWFSADGFLRDPERRGLRAGPRQPGAPDNRTPYSGGFNPPYTYPDLNHVYLAAVKADGTLLLPSFHRPWSGFGTLGPENTNWYDTTKPWLKYLVLRPRPADMGPGFPVPEDAGGDVKNLLGAPGGNDSIWLDLDFPVLRAPDGRKYKPLFAPLVLDLDGRVNLAVHGNLRGLGGAVHTSHQGWGPWEVNPGQLSRLPPPRDPGYRAALARRLEWGQLLRGLPPSTAGRFGWEGHPHSARPNNLALLPLGRFTAPADYDGSREAAVGIPPIAGRPTAQIALPGSQPTPAWLCFPLHGPGSGYGNGSPAERLDHPLLYNPFAPYGPDRSFALSELEALLRSGDTGSPALGSELLRLCPKNLLGSDADSARRRRMLTLASFDPDRPGVSPWFWASPVNGSPEYDRLPTGALHPYGPAVLAPRPPVAESEFGPDGRTAAALTALRRVNLNRYLPDYPLPDPTTGRISDPLTFTVAQTARQHFAAELFEVLWRTTGAGDPALAAPPGSPLHDPTRWDAFRYLAQLAVNIVDFIDNDDYSTPFNWRPDPVVPGGGDWVYGTELPRVLLNEAYVEYTNDPNDRGLLDRPPHATRFKGNVWVELHNTSRNDPPLTAPWRSGTVRLEVPPASGAAQYAPYRLVIAQLRPREDIRSPANMLGEVTLAQVKSALSTFTPLTPATVDTQMVLPANLSNPARGYAGPAGGNEGFYVLGPQLGPTEASPFAPGMETLRRPEMSFLVTANEPRLLLEPTLLWQRLACPHLPPQGDPRLPLYNPYITIDYLRNVKTNYAAAVGIHGPLNPMPQQPAERSSVGKRQPYAAHLSQVQLQRPFPAMAAQPQTTFFQHNADSTTPVPNVLVPPPRYPAFDWLVHLDRPPISPAELLQVSAYKPHELTQQFRVGDLQQRRFTHRAPWLDEDLPSGGPSRSHRLYRALEFLTVGARWPGGGGARTTAAQAVPAGRDVSVTPAAMAGVTPSGGMWGIERGGSLVIDRGLPSEEVVRVKEVGPPGQRPVWFKADFLRPHRKFTIDPLTVSERLPGKINLNTVWDEEVFQALCDANPANSFNANTVRTTFNHLIASRSTGPGHVPGLGDRPFLGLAVGLGGDGNEGGRQHTLLRSPPRRLGDPPILAVAGRSHPYQTYELLTKIFNSTTTRSNVFAVWLTVGFFEVTNDAKRPIELGPEIGRAEGRHVRHRMFAVVDRSVLVSNPGPQPRFDPRAVPSGYAVGRPVPWFSIID